MLASTQSCAALQRLHWQMMLSIQVHKAALRRPGRDPEVAVKVQYPRALETMLQVTEAGRSHSISRIVCRPLSFRPAFAHVRLK